jgi:hypothetical protein
MKSIIFGFEEKDIFGFPMMVQRANFTKIQREKIVLAELSRKLSSPRRASTEKSRQMVNFQNSSSKAKNKPKK